MNVRLPDHELALFTAAAQERGVSLSDWIRTACRSWLRVDPHSAEGTPPPPIPEPEPEPQYVTQPFARMK